MLEKVTGLINEIIDPLPRFCIPAGPGMFLWLLARNGTPAQVASQALELGIKWCAIKVVNGMLVSDGYDTFEKQKPLGSQVTYKPEDYIAALRSAGIAVHGWGYDYGYYYGGDILAGEVRAILAAIRRFNLDSYMFDVEGEWEGQGEKRASSLIGRVRDGVGKNYALGFTTYRFISKHGTFPWKPFFDGCDYAVPQVYWELAPDQAGAQLRQSLKEYRNYRQSIPFIPAGAAYPHGKWKPAVDELWDFYDTVKELGLPGWCWWEWNFAHDAPEWWQAICAQNKNEPQIAAPAVEVEPSLQEKVELMWTDYKLTHPAIKI